MADARALSLEKGRRLITRHAGVFLFLPLLAQLGFDRMVRKAGYPGTQMVPAPSALLSLLTLKLLDKERLHHIDDFNCDEALGMFAGLNILPKKSFATDYSYRTTRPQQEALLEGWVKGLSSHLFPDADSFSLDFHAIGHRGEETDLENHYQPMRGKAGPSVLTFFAMEQNSRVFCYSNANLTRAEQSIDRPGQRLLSLARKSTTWLRSRQAERAVPQVRGDLRRRGGSGRPPDRRLFGPPKPQSDPARSPTRRSQPQNPLAGQPPHRIRVQLTT